MPSDSPAPADSRDPLFRDAPTLGRGVPSLNRAVALACIAVALATGPAHASSLPGPDTLGVRLETGAGTDITNEQYYEDAFVDTTFLGRQRVSTPETRYAGFVTTSLMGTRGERRAAYQVFNELSLGDKVQRDALSMSWRDNVTPDWRVVLNPSLSWRHDQTFGRDQDEWRGSFRGRLRRSFDDDATSAELGMGGDVLRTHGEGSQFLLDRNAAVASFALDHLALLGDDWRLGYGLAWRVFPDSSVRDHLENAWEGRWHHPFLAGHSLTLETSGTRRQTVRIVSDSRDNYWEELASAEGDARLADRWVVRMRLEGEARQYDVQDSTVYFDYQILRGRLEPRFENGGRWSLSAGPRAEILRSPLSPDESYDEIGGAVEFELLGSGALWSLTPAAGWRAYDASPLSLHSSYAFYELDAFIDQALVTRIRVRLLTSLRLERHTDSAEDAASIYLSMQLRWLAR